ncbi:hypothetical protein C8Q79DRAFT_120672 [Trametes meyenii]|nr:hypothetical protein C8Q79DRAFT_120672 [Trametes meyenii]
MCHVRVNPVCTRLGPQYMSLPLFVSASGAIFPDSQSTQSPWAIPFFGTRGTYQPQALFLQKSLDHPTLPVPWVNSFNLRLTVIIFSMVNYRISRSGLRRDDLHKLPFSIPFPMLYVLRLPRSLSPSKTWAHTTTTTWRQPFIPSTCEPLLVPKIGLSRSSSNNTGSASPPISTGVSCMHRSPAKARLPTYDPLPTSKSTLTRSSTAVRSSLVSAEANESRPPQPRAQERHPQIRIAICFYATPGTTTIASRARRVRRVM